MLTFFRRIINSRIGIVITLATLGIIALAFAAGDVTGLRTGGMGGLSGNDVAKVGGDKITVAEFRSRVENELEGARQQQPQITMAEFAAQGGIEGTLDRLVTGLSLSAFGQAQGMVVSKRSVDGTLASIPALKGPNGQFDMAIYRRLLVERHLTDTVIRTDIARQTIVQQLTAPAVGAAQVPQQLALPYASLLLEKRSGELGLVPVAVMAKGAPPTDAEIAAFYQRNGARYTVPQRRVVRYVTVTADSVKAKATPTDAEVAAAYAADRARFAAAEKRTIEQVVAIDQATAARIAASIKAGAAVADAARTVGLEASTQTEVDKAAYAALNAQPVADQLFAAPAKTVVGPLKVPLGWVVARVTAVRAVAGKSLAEARAELVDEIAKRKTNQALSALHDKMDDALANNSTFDEVVADQKLQPLTTPPIVADASNPDQPGARPDPALAPIAAAAFKLEDGDAPQLVQINPAGDFALVALGRIVPAAPRPLASVRAAVTTDFLADRARQQSRRVAAAILARAKGGTSLAQAIAAAGVPLPTPRPVSSSRAEIAANPRAANPAIVLMFSMAEGTTKLLEAPDGRGWLIVKLDHIDRGDASRQPGIVQAARTDMGRVIGREYVEQFARAVRADVGVKIDNGAVGRVKAELIGANGGATN